MNINNIVIVGGGSAGWMTAAILKHDFPEKEVTVIESPNISTVGVGESTYDGINYYLEYIDVDRDDFFSYTDASIKLGLEFKNFYDNDGSSFLYPFGSSCIDGTIWGMKDWMIRKYLDPSIPVTDFAESYFPVAHLIKHNSFYENANGELPNFNSTINTALHFDATKFAEWLRDKYCIPRGVNHVLDEVKMVDVDNDRVTGLQMESGEYITADLFVDCTGFRSLLLGQALNEPFISYSDKLPNNSAWATQIPYDDKDKEMTSVTRCTALNNGWAWNIPLYSRLGSGYVYSNKFVSKEDALQEFKEYLSSELMDHPKSKDIVDSLQFKHIDMRVGMHERIWVNNVVGIGLSAAFIEPLESNGLFSIHEFLFYLVRALNRKKVTSWDIHIFNKSAKDLYNSFAEFIRLHYSLSVRDDTEYWKSNSTRNYTYEDIILEDYNTSYTFKLYEMKTKTYTPEPQGGFPTGIACISTGMNFLILDNVAIKTGEIEKREGYSSMFSTSFNNFDNKKRYWDGIASFAPKLPEYIKNKYHGDEDNG